MENTAKIVFSPIETVCSCRIQSSIDSWVSISGGRRKSAARQGEVLFQLEHACEYDVIFRNDRLVWLGRGMI